MQPGSMDSLLAKLSEQQALLAKQKTVVSSNVEEDDKQAKDDSTSGSTLLTPASDSFRSSDTAQAGDEALQMEAAEMLRLKKELDAAKNQIARQKHELDQSRVLKHTVDQAMASPSEAVFSPKPNVFEQANGFPTSGRSFTNLPGNWPNDDARSDISDLTGTIPNVWPGSSRPSFNTGLQAEGTWGQSGPRSWGQRAVSNTLPPLMMAQQPPVQQRNYSVPVSPASAGGRSVNEFGTRGYGHLNTQNNRNASAFQRGNGWDVYTGGPGPMDGVNLGGMSPGSAYPSLGIYPTAYQPRPIGTPLSPTATEFRAGQASTNPWNTAVSSSSYPGDGAAQTQIHINENGSHGTKILHHNLRALSHSSR